MAREIREFRSPTDGETRMFYEIVIAPSYTPEGLEVLKGKSKMVSEGHPGWWGGECVAGEQLD
jgi:phosphoribosylaminoimidazolecarboxamide formyltransferase/IMP cyclohydrolase